MSKKSYSYITLIDLQEILPKHITVGLSGKEIPLQVFERGEHLLLKYTVNRDTEARKAGNREFSEIIPRFVCKTRDTFEVLGLLQAEMGKTQNGCLTFCNSEYRLIKKVMTWFEKELEISTRDWRWYVKVNLNHDVSLDYKEKIEQKVLFHWTDKTRINPNMAYPKKVTYLSTTKKKRLLSYDYGSLIIEIKNNLLSQVIKRYVKFMSYSILQHQDEYIRAFMRGILAGESCVEINNRIQNFRVHLSAVKVKERQLYGKCLETLGIFSKQYEGYKDIIISKRENLFELLQQKLMCLSPKKYNKFLRIKEFYKNYYDLDLWKERNKLLGPPNKTPSEVINKIFELHHENPGWSCCKIAQKVNVSPIKVCRVRKENGLGNRVSKTPEYKRMEIAALAVDYPHLRQCDIAAYFEVHESIVRRAISKFRSYSTS